MQSTDYYLVEVTVSADNRITVEIDAFDGVSIDFCADLNRHIESKLDREEEDYELEVGSAGIGQPFRVVEQYRIHIGDPVEVLDKDKKKWTGILKDVSDAGFTVTVEVKVKPEGAKRPRLEERDMTFSYDDIKYTKYSLSMK